MRVFAALVLAVSIGATSPSAFAQPQVVLTLDPAAQQQIETALGLNQGELAQLIDDELRALYGLVDVPTFLRLSANAQSMANKGLGIDYASNVSDWVFGVAVSAAADAGDSDVEDFRALADGNTERAVPVSAGAQIGLMLGYQVIDRLTVYANGLYYPLSIDNDLDGTFFNFGLHAQYKAVPAIGQRSLVHWGGVDVSTGIEFSRMLLELEGTFDARGTLVDGVDLDTVSTGTLDLEQRAITLPFEVSTNLTLFYFLTLYGGMALDVQLGDASARLDLDTELATAAPLGGTLDLGSAQIAVNDIGDPDRVMFRLMGGLQLNIWKIKLFAQANVLTSDLTVGLAAGLRVVL